MFGYSSNEQKYLSFVGSRDNREELHRFRNKWIKHEMDNELTLNKGIYSMINTINT